MTRLTLIAFLAALAVPMAAAAQQSPKPAPKPAEAQPKAPPEKNDPNKLVCTSVKVTGSNMARRVCKTQAEIEKERAHAEWFLENAKLQANSSIATTRN